MKKQLTILLLAFAVWQAYSQQINVKKLMTEHFLNCDDIYYNNAHLIPKYYQQKSLDTVQALVQYWEQECGEIEPVFRTKILLGIEKGADVNDLNAKKTLAGLEYYLSEKKLYEYYFNRALEQNNFIGQNRLLNIYGQYYDFTKKWALQLLKNKNLNDDQKFVLEVYADKIKSLDGLEKPPYDKTVLYKTYVELKNEQEKSKRNYDFYYTLNAGMWVPTDNLQILGNHPQLGFRLGTYYKKWTFDMELMVAFLKSSNEYLSPNNGQLMLTDKFTKPFIGFNAAYHLYQTDKVAIYISSGLGYESITTFSADENLANNNEEIFLNSFNVNTGMGVKYFIKNSFLSLEVKYRVSDFDNGDGTDLSGNAFGINFIYGYSFKKVPRANYAFF